MNPLLEKAREQEEAFPIGSKIRERFARGDVIAAAGHSLSRPCKKAEELVAGVFQKVKDELHGVHFPSGYGKAEQDRDSDYAFKLHLHKPACGTLSQLLGCDVGDVNLGNGLSDDLIRLIETHIHPEIFGKRRKMVCLSRDFNSDLTIVRCFLIKAIVNALLAVRPIFEGTRGVFRNATNSSSIVDQIGEEYRRLCSIFLRADVSEEKQFQEIRDNFLVEIPSTEQGLYETDTIVNKIAQCHDELAGALLPAVVFHTSQLMDVKTVNAALIDRGIFCVWDFAHSIGNVLHDVVGDKVLAGAGCGYKHLNGLPGGPGFIYQNAKLIREMWSSSGEGDAPVMRPTPVSGWLSHGRTNPFDAFPTIDRFSVSTLQPVESVQRLRASNPEVLALKVLIANLAIIDEFGVSSIMQLKEALTVCLFKALEHYFADEIRNKEFTFITPRERTRRGATICFSVAGVDAKRLEEALLVDKHQLGHKFEVDVRPGATKDDPDTFRVTAHYSHMGFTDAVNLAYCLYHCYKAELNQ